MLIRTKKLHNNNLIKLQADGEIKEIIINEKLVGEKSLSICFRGQDSSGILDLSEKEIEEINKEMNRGKKLIGNVKIFRNS